MLEQDNTWLLGAAVCVLLFGCIVVRRMATVWLGLSLLNVAIVGSATLPVFILGTAFDKLPQSHNTEHHFEVVRYSVAGIFAMLLGLLAASSQEKVGHRAPSALVASAERWGILSFCVGTGAALAYQATAAVASVSTLFYALSGLARLGIFLLVLNGVHTGRWKGAVLAGATYLFLSIISSFSSGHTFLTLSFVVPVILLLTCSRGVKWWSAVVVALSVLLLSPVYLAWMNTRFLIRDGALSTLTSGEKFEVFFDRFFNGMSFPTIEGLIEAVELRIDMTALLALQVLHQPRYEPYAYGETFIDAMTSLIPRFFWTEKPQIAGGSDFVSRFTGLVRPPGDTTSIGLPYPFELYANGGTTLVIVGLFLIAFATARLESRVYCRPISLPKFWSIGLALLALTEGGQRMDVVIPSALAGAISGFIAGVVVEKMFRQPCYPSLKKGTAS
jgi:hypothetical protein